MEKKLWYYGKNLWYYGKNYDTIPKTMEIGFTMQKTMVLWKKKYGTTEKNYGSIVNYCVL